MLGDLEFRGHARPATEEFNLAAYYDEQDVCRAEFLRTFTTVAFLGGELLNREEFLAKEQADWLFANRDNHEACAPSTILKVQQEEQLSFVDAYGFQNKMLPTILFIPMGILQMVEMGETT